MSPRLLTFLFLLLPSVCLCARPPRGNLRFAGKRFPPPPCCNEVSATNISSDVIRQTYHEQSAKPPCVRAIILITNRGPVCVDPDARWVKTFTANMTKV